MSFSRKYRVASLMVVALALTVGCANALKPPGPGVEVEDLGAALESGPDSAVSLRVQTLAHGLLDPWAMDFLPDGSLLITEKRGNLKRIDVGANTIRDISGPPEVANAGQGGFMDVRVHPQFERNGLVYFSYAVEEGGKYSTRASRARLQGARLLDHEVLFTAKPFFRERRHFGSRLLLDNGYLYVSVGDRGHRDGAQSLDSHNGKIMRIMEDGNIPTDNPFIDQPGALPEIWTYGHRNPQGMARHPVTGAVWISEHGPQGGDEINQLKPGANYGWPVITHGEEYGGGKIGEGTDKPGMEQPLAYYTPSIGTAGIDFYKLDTYPGWDRSLLVAGLRQSQIARLQLTEEGVGRRTQMLASLGMRIRDVKIGPDGLVYALADGSRLIRLVPE